MKSIEPQLEQISERLGQVVKALEIEYPGLQWDVSLQIHPDNVYVWDVKALPPGKEGEHWITDTVFEVAGIEEE